MLSHMVSLKSDCKTTSKLQQNLACSQLAIWTWPDRNCQASSSRQVALMIN